MVMLKPAGTPEPAGSLPRWLLCSPFRTKGPEPRRSGTCGGVFLWVQCIRPHWRGSFVSGARNIPKPPFRFRPLARLDEEQESERAGS
jgi:hypothetical protein